MTQTGCDHLPDVLPDPTPSGQGCAACLEAGRSDWMHLRICQICGNVGCCDQSPGTHATKHYRETGHTLLRSFEPGEEWWYCYADDAAFMIDDGPAAKSYAA